LLIVFEFLVGFFSSAKHKKYLLILKEAGILFSKF
jgi:hypothetical protein